MNEFPSAWRIMIKIWGRVLPGGMIKINRFNFLTHKCIAIINNTITLRLFNNHGGIYRFRKMYKKDSGEINLLRVPRNMRVCILEINCEGLGW